MLKDNIKYCHVNNSNERSFYFDHVHIFWNEQITFHQQAEWELSYIVKGSGTRIIGDIVENFSSDEVVFLPPNMPHGWYFNEYDHDKEGKIENITIIFSDSLLEKCSNSFAEASPHISKIKEYEKAVRFEGKTLHELQKIMIAMVAQNNIERLSSLLNIFFILASSNEMQVAGSIERFDKHAAKVQEIMRFIVNNYQGKISLEDAAKYVGMNRSSFCTFFKKEKGKPFFTVLNEYRIDCSCFMLRETTMGISDICYAVGFDDVPYYNRTFKKLKGETPREYRAKQKLMK